MMMMMMMSTTTNAQGLDLKKIAVKRIQNQAALTVVRADCVKNQDAHSLTCCFFS